MAASGAGLVGIEARKVGRVWAGAETSHEPRDA